MCSEEWTWPAYNGVSAIIKDAKKCQPATRRRAPVEVISMYDVWNVSGMFVYKEGRRRNIWHLCMERRVMIFPTLMPAHSEHGILLARLQWGSPANSAFYFFSPVFVFVGSVNAREIRCSHGREPPGQMTKNNYIISANVKIWAVLLRWWNFVLVFSLIYSVKRCKSADNFSQTEVYQNFLCSKISINLLTAGLVWLKWIQILFKAPSGNVSNEVLSGESEVCVPADSVGFGRCFSFWAKVFCKFCFFALTCICMWLHEMNIPM